MCVQECNTLIGHMAVCSYKKIGEIAKKFSLCAQHNIPEVLDDIRCIKIGLINNI